MSYGQKSDFQDGGRRSQITWFLLVLRWATDAIYDFHGPME